MTEQTVYRVVNVDDYEEPAFVRLYDNRAAADQHAAQLNKLLGSDEDEPVFEVWDWAVRSEFKP